MSAIQIHSNSPSQSPRRSDASREGFGQLADIRNLNIREHIELSGDRELTPAQFRRLEQTFLQTLQDMTGHEDFLPAEHLTWLGRYVNADLERKASFGNLESRIRGVEHLLSEFSAVYLCAKSNIFASYQGIREIAPAQTYDATLIMTVDDFTEEEFHLDPCKITRNLFVHRGATCRPSIDFAEWQPRIDSAKKTLEHQLKCNITDKGLTSDHIKTLETAKATLNSPSSGRDEFVKIAESHLRHYHDDEAHSPLDRSTLNSELKRMIEADQRMNNHLDSERGLLKGKIRTIDQIRMTLDNGDQAWNKELDRELLRKLFSVSGVSDILGMNAEFPASDFGRDGRRHAALYEDTVRALSESHPGVDETALKCAVKTTYSHGSGGKGAALGVLDLRGLDQREESLVLELHEQICRFANERHPGSVPDILAILHPDLRVSADGGAQVLQRLRDAQQGSIDSPTSSDSYLDLISEPSSTPDLMFTLSSELDE